MTHLKKFNHQTKNILDDLEDYLQELFDKYHIKKSIGISPDHIHYWVNYVNNSIYIESIEKGGTRLDKSKKWFKIYEEILRILPTVEKRLGLQLEIIGDYNKRDFMKIKIINETSEEI